MTEFMIKNNNGHYLTVDGDTRGWVKLAEDATLFDEKEARSWMRTFRCGGVPVTCESIFDECK